MPVVTIVVGALLTGLGLFGYFGAEEANRSGTAFIPAGVGVPLILCGLIALKESLLAHAMHGAAVFGLLGLIASGGRAGMKAAKGTLDLSARADQMVVAMAVVCLVFVALCVNSFIQAKRRRKAQAN